MTVDCRAGAIALQDGQPILRVGRKAKASAAFASASSHLRVGLDLVHSETWGSPYQLALSLRLESAECEFLTGNLNEAERLISKSSHHGATKVDPAAASRFKIELHVVRGEYSQGVDSALTCLNLFGIDIPAHPSSAQLQSEYETVWRNLAGRSIKSFIDLPLIVDCNLQAAMEILAALDNCSLFTDSNLYCLLQCRLVNLSLLHGMSGASARD